MRDVEWSGRGGRWAGERTGEVHKQARMKQIKRDWQKEGMTQFCTNKVQRNRERRKELTKIIHNSSDKERANEACKDIQATKSTKSQPAEQTNKTASKQTTNQPTNRPTNQTDKQTKHKQHNIAQHKTNKQTNKQTTNQTHKQTNT